MPFCNLSTLALFVLSGGLSSLAYADRWVCMDSFLHRNSISQKAKVIGLNADGDLLVAEPNGDLFIAAAQPGRGPRVSYFGHVDLEPGERLAGINPLGHIVVVNAKGRIDMFSETTEQMGERWHYGHVTLQPREYISGVVGNNQVIIADRDGNVFQLSHVRIPGLKVFRGKVTLDPGQRIIGYSPRGHAVVADDQGNVFLHVLDLKKEGQLWSYASIQDIRR